MKKFFIFILLIATINVKGLEKSIIDYTSGVDGKIVQKTIIENIDNEESLIMSSNTGIYIKNKEGYRHISTNQNPVSVILIDDINKDDHKDIVYAVNSKNGLYNVVAVSGIDDKVIWTTMLSEKKFSFYENSGNENISIYKIEQVGNSIVVISDYSIYVLNIKNGKTIFKYKDKDNIWDVAEVKDINNNSNEEIAISNQLGEVKLIDSKTGLLLWNKTIIDKIDTTRDNKIFDVKRNIWQVEFVSDNLYAMGEDGTLFVINHKTGDVVNKLNVYELDSDTLNEYYYNEGFPFGNSLTPTNKKSEYFNNFEMKFNGDKVMISAFLNASDRDKSYSMKPHVITVDLKKLEVLSDVEISNLELVNVEALDLDTIFLLPVSEKDGYLTIDNYEYATGKKVSETKVFLGTLINAQNKKKIYLSNTKEGVLLEQGNGFSVILDSNNKDIKINNNSYSKTKILKSNNEELYVSYESNGIVYKVSKFDGLESTEPKWEYNIPKDIKNNGLFSISITQDFNKDGIPDITALFNKIDNENRVVASYFLILDSTNGNTISFKSIHTGSYISNGKKIDTYFTGSKLEAIRDMNGDKVSELLVDSTIINGSKISIYGMFDTSLNGESAKIFNVGDINNDSISDIVAIESAQGLLFTSKISGPVITYVKTNKKVTFAKDVLNLDYSTMVPDINNDGIKEIVINDRDQAKKQVFKILSGKDLSTIFTITDVNFYGSSYLFFNDDINNDGFNDIAEIINGINYNFISGKDGKSLYKIEQELQNENGEIPYKEISPSIDYEFEGVMMFNYEEANYSVVPGIDLTDDGKKEIYILTEEYYPKTKLILEIYDINSKGTKPIRSIDLFFESEYGKGVIEEFDSNEFNYFKQIIEVLNGEGLYIVKPPGNVSLIYDAKKNKVLSEVNASMIKAIKTSDNKIFGITTENSPISINFKNDFIVKNLKEGNVYKSPLKINLNESNKEDMRVVKIFNNGTLLSTQYDNNFDLLLKRGDYNLVFKATDRWGKTQNYSLDITIDKTNPYIIVTSLIGILIIAVLLFLSIGHKIKRKLTIRRIYG